jgi:hypothetical protein
VGQLSGGVIGRKNFPIMRIHNYTIDGQDKHDTRRLHLDIAHSLLLVLLVSGLVKVINAAFVVFNVERLLDTDNGNRVRVFAVSESRPLFVSSQGYQ